MKIAVLDARTVSLHNDLSLSGLSRFGTVEIYPYTMPDEVVLRCRGAEIVLVNKTRITNEMVDACNELQYIGLLSTGTDVIEDLDYLAKKGIVVTNVPDYSTNAVAQMAFAHILHFYNRVSEHDAFVKAGKWQQQQDFCFYLEGIHALAGKTIGIVGFGKTGREVARVAKAFRMDCLVFTRTPGETEQDLRFVDFNTLLKNSDIISIHCPLNAQTRGMFSESALLNCKKSALLINLARGGIVDEAAVCNALQEGLIAGYGTDVAQTEPIASDSPLLRTKNCVVTPHAAWGARETRQRLLQEVIGNISAFLDGRPIHVVNTLGDAI